MGIRGQQLPPLDCPLLPFIYRVFSPGGDCPLPDLGKGVVERVEGFEEAGPEASLEASQGVLDVVAQSAVVGAAVHHLGLGLGLGLGLRFITFLVWPRHGQTDKAAHPWRPRQRMRAEERKASAATGPLPRGERHRPLSPRPRP